MAKRYATFIAIAGLLGAASVVAAGEPGVPCHVQQILGPTPTGMENWGRVAMGGQIAVVGVIGPELLYEGSAHIHRRLDDAFVLQAIMHSAVVEGENGYGLAVATDGAIIVVGDAFESSPLPGSGAVYVYRMSDGVPIFEQKLTASNAGVFDSFGQSVAVSGDAIIVGDWKHDTAGISDAGAAYVFRYTDGRWVEETILTDHPPEPFDGFGTAVGIVGNVAMVSAEAENGPGNNTGAVSVFRYDGGTWSFEQILQPSDAVKFPNNLCFGHSLALDGDGDTAVLGAHEAFGQLGAAWVFEYDGATWIETAKLLAQAPVGGATFFGGDVDISADGQTILIGASGDAEAGGAAHLFRRIGGQWVEVQKITIPGSACFAGSVALEGDMALAGDGCNSPGVVHVFAGLAAIDCNGNGAPDSCDMWKGSSSDADGNGIPDECLVPGDANGDGFVDVSDLIAVILGWGECAGRGPCPGDISGNGTVDVEDLTLIVLGWAPGPPPIDCPGADDCCAPHAAPGCQTVACCEAVCAADAFCCTTAWDAICVNEAQLRCGCPPPQSCGAGGAGDCCTYGGLAGPGCGDAVCCETICDYLDPFCCQTLWDASCALWALQFCQCPPIFCNPKAGECCVTGGGGNGTPGCEDLDCCVLVCSIDPFCCDAVWDGICGEWAFKFCKICGGQPPSP